MFVWEREREICLPEKVYFSKKRIASRYCDHKMGDALLLLLLLHALCTCTTNRGGPLRWGTCKTCKPEGSSVSRVYNTIVDKRIAGTTENLYSALPEVSCCVDCNRYKVSKIVDETSWQEMQIKSQVCVSWALSLHVTRARSRERIHTHTLDGLPACTRKNSLALSLSLFLSLSLSVVLSLSIPLSPSLLFSVCPLSLCSFSLLSRSWLRSRSLSLSALSLSLSVSPSLSLSLSLSLFLSFSLFSLSRSLSLSLSLCLVLFLTLASRSVLQRANGFFYEWAETQRPRAGGIVAAQAWSKNCHILIFWFWCWYWHVPIFMWFVEYGSNAYPLPMLHVHIFEYLNPLPQSACAQE